MITRRDLATGAAGIALVTAGTRDAAAQDRNGITDNAVKIGVLGSLTGVQAVFGPIVELAQFHKAGSIRVLGVTSAKRAAAMPDVPPIAEDVPGYAIGTWHGLFAPKGTPAPIAEQMSRAMAAALEDTAPGALRVTLLANVTAAPVTDPAEVRRLLVEQVTGRVRWRESMLALGAAGVDHFVELGGKVVGPMITRTVADVAVASLVGMADIEALAKEL
jgi:hypothetical protein